MNIPLNRFDVCIMSLEDFYSKSYYNKEEMIKEHIIKNYGVPQNELIVREIRFHQDFILFLLEITDE